MPNKTSAPGAQQKRLAAYLDSLAQAAGHADRNEPLKGYCKGLLLPLKRKSVEPMAARLAPHNVRRTHQSLHHLVADSPWSDQALLAQVRAWTLPLMKKRGPLVAWVVDDTGIPKKGRHSVGVARQYCGQLGKQENCQVAVSRSAASGATVCRSPGASACPRVGRAIASGGAKPACPRKFVSKLNHKSRSIRFARRSRTKSSRAWCWPTRPMAMTARFGPSCGN